MTASQRERRRRRKAFRQEREDLKWHRLGKGKDGIQNVWTRWKDR